MKALLAIPVVGVFMQRMFSIALSRNVEFSVVAVANEQELARIYSLTNGNVEQMKKLVKTSEVPTVFQGMVNGIPFVEDRNYETIRTIVMNAVEINKPQDKAGLC